MLPKYQRQQIGTHLMDSAEAIISKKSRWAGISVVLAPGYNVVQAMYVRRGYVPDGLGVSYNNKFVDYSETVLVDDELVLHLKKQL